MGERNQWRLQKFWSEGLKVGEWKWKEVTQLCLTLCDSMDCSLPGSSVYGIFQARILEQVAISFSRGFSQPRNGTCVSCTGRRILYHYLTCEAKEYQWLQVNIKNGKLGRTCHIWRNERNSVQYDWSSEHLMALGSLGTERKWSGESWGWMC